MHYLAVLLCIKTAGYVPDLAMLLLNIAERGFLLVLPCKAFKQVGFSLQDVLLDVEILGFIPARREIKKERKSLSFLFNFTSCREKPKDFHV